MRAQSLSRNHLFRHRRLPTVPKINPVRGENPNHQYPERESEILGNLHPTNSTNKNPLGSPMSAGKIRMTAPLPLLTKRLREKGFWRSEEHTSELQSRQYLVCRLLLEKK